MSVESHINQLETRHRTLETELSKVSTSPGIDPIKVAELKRQKLWLKDEIVRLQHKEIVH